jgi:hypothetical protein
MLVLNYIVTYEGNKRDGSPPVTEGLAVETYIFLQLSLHKGKHCRRLSSEGTSHELHLIQVSSE